MALCSGGGCRRVSAGPVLGLLALLAFASLAFAPGVASAQSAAASTSSIIVEGNRRVDAEAVRSFFRAGPGGRLEEAATDRALKALYASGMFRDAKISRRDGRLVVTVVEAPLIDKVRFEGNKSVKEEQLNTEIQSKARAPLSQAKVQSDV